jgi:hypothetical protein
MGKTPPISRIDFTHDKLGRRTGVTYYYKVEFGHRKLLENLIKDYSMPDEDVKMCRRLLRVGEYSEHDRDRLVELRKIYLRDKT